MPNIELHRRLELSTFRHISLGTWRTAYDPSIYGSVTLEMGEVVRYIDVFRRATGRHLTVSHLMAKVIGVVLEEVPELNVLLRWGGLYRRETIGVFFQVAIEDPQTGSIDLSGLKVDEPQRKSLTRIMDDFEAGAADVRAKKRAGLERSRSMLRRIPGLLIGPTLRFMTFLGYTLNLDLRRFGVPKDPFGSAMVTNIGSLGLDNAYAPLVPFSGVPFLLAMGAIHDAPVAVDGRVEVRPVMRLSATFDHRVMDGLHASRAVAILRRWLEDPFEHFGPIEAAPSAPPQSTLQRSVEGGSS